MSDRNFQADGTGGVQAKSGAGAGSAARGRQGDPAGGSAKAEKRGKRTRRGLPESIRKSVEKMEAKYGEVFDWLATR